MDTRTRPVVDPRTSLALWLRAGRAQRKLTLDDVARVTKIQPRILEKLETGQLEGLPAEVFVRGFVKSFARCVGLDEGEAAERYGACAGVEATPATTAARAFVETLVAAPARESRAAAGTPSVALPVVAPALDLQVADTQVADTQVADTVTQLADAQLADTQLADTQLADTQLADTQLADNTPPVDAAIEVITSSEAIPAPKKKRAPRKKASTTGAPATRSRKKKPTVEPELAAGSLEMTPAPPLLEMPPASPSDLAMGSLEMQASSGELATEATAISIAIEVIDQSAPTPVDDVELAQGSVPVSAFDMPTWQPTMPPITATPSVPWKRPSTSVTSTAYVAPSLVIDDADPDLADLERDEREAAAKAGPHRVSFLPPILLDRDDKSGRQGGLTLAVIILLIAATLTLSYLMRRPSVSGDGVTVADPVATSTLVA